MQQRFVMTNSFHNTEHTALPHVRPNGDLYLSPSQVKRAHDHLCGSPDCTCGDITGSRPHRWESTQERGAILQR